MASFSAVVGPNVSYIWDTPVSVIGNTLLDILGGCAERGHVFENELAHLTPFGATSAFVDHYEAVVGVRVAERARTHQRGRRCSRSLISPANNSRSSAASVELTWSVVLWPPWTS